MQGIYTYIPETNNAPSENIIIIIIIAPLLSSLLIFLFWIQSFLSGLKRVRVSDRIILNHYFSIKFRTTKHVTQLIRQLMHL